MALLLPVVVSSLAIEPAIDPRTFKASDLPISVPYNGSASRGSSSRSPVRLVASSRVVVSKAAPRPPPDGLKERQDAKILAKNKEQQALWKTQADKRAASCASYANVTTRTVDNSARASFVPAERTR